MKHCRSRTTSSPAEAELVGAACCQLEAAAWCLYSPQEQINPELYSCLQWEGMTSWAQALTHCSALSEQTLKTLELKNHL